MPDEPEESFTVHDRRRFLTEDAEEAERPAAAPAPASSSAAAPFFSPDAADEMQEPEGLGPDDYAGTGELPDVYSVLALFLGELRNLAWLRMGLVANPGTGQIERDMNQAKVAIDTVAFLASQLEPVVAPEERLPLKALVSDLQVNFVEQGKRDA